MTKKQKFKYFILGAIVTLLIGNLCIPALAALVDRSIAVSSGVNLYKDDVRFTPMDANGKTVEAFIYDGTTYLPVRAVANLFDTAIAWEGSTQSVYIGKHDSDEPSIMLLNLKDTGGESIDSGKSITDNRGNRWNNAISMVYSDLSRTYNLNGKYRKMTGVLVHSGPDPYWTGSGSLEIIGDGKQLLYKEISETSDPIPFSIDLTGVLELQFKRTVSHGGYLVECGLYQ